MPPRPTRVLPLVLLLMAAPAAAQPQPLVITGGTIVDPGAPGTSRVASLVVEHGVVRAIVDGPTVPANQVPAGARVVDASGRFLLPGLWDMHAHLAALTPVDRAPERYVGHGVLHLRDMGGHLDSLLPLRAAIDRGDRVGPTVVIAGPTLNGIQPADFHRQVTTADEARVAVRELHGQGVDFIKHHRATGREAFDAIAQEAGRLGLPFAGHVPLVMSWEEAAQAGIRSIEHIQTIFENLEPDGARLAGRFLELADRLDGALGDSIFAVLARHGTFFDPTLAGYETSFATTNPTVAALRRRAFERMKPLVGKAARAGVPIVVGTDVLRDHGAMVHRELELLVEAGLSPQEAVAAATVTAARAAGRPELGRIAVGAPASFLVLGADPFAGVDRLRQLHAVVLRGRWLDGTVLTALRQ